MREYQTENHEAIDVMAKNREVKVTFPLTVYIDENHIYCNSENDLEVWYFHKDEYEIYCDRISDMVAFSLQNPKEIVKREAIHIVSDYMAKER